MENNKDKKDRVFMILESKDDQVHARIQGGIYYYYFPKDKYEEYKRKYGLRESTLIEESPEAKAKREAAERRAYDKETEEIIEIFNDRDKRTKTEIEVYPIRRVEETATRPVKRTIKNSPQKKKNQRYKGNRKERAKALLASLLIVLSIGAGVRGIESYIEYTDSFNATATKVQNMSEEEIRTEIDNILKQEISDATGAGIEDIDISQYAMGSSTKRTKVEVGDESYIYDVDLRSLFNIGNTLKSNGISEIVEAANNAKGDRKKLIKALMKAREFSKEKDLVLDDDVLKEKGARGEER